MKVTSTDARLQGVFAEMKAQLETVIDARGNNAYRYDAATATGILADRSKNGALLLFSQRAVGLELCFAIRADGFVFHYESDGFAMRLLEAWAQEIGASTRDAAQREKAPCPFFGAIKAAYAAAQSRGLDVKNDNAMRRAVNRYVGHAQNASRKLLNGSQWSTVAQAIERGELAW